MSILLRSQPENDRRAVRGPKPGKKPVTGTSLRRVFGTLLWPRRRLLMVGVVLITVSRLSGLVLPGATKVLLDDVVTAGDHDKLKWLLIVVGVAIAVQAITSFLLTQLLSVEAQRLIAELRAKVQSHVLSLPTRAFDTTRSGTLVTRIMDDVVGVRNLIGTGLVQLVGGVITATVALVLLLRIDVTLTLTALVPLILFGLGSMKAFGFVRPIFRERSVIRGEVAGRLTEALGGIRVIKGFHAEDRERAIFSDGTQRIFANVRRTLVATSLVTSSATLLLGLVSVAIMGIGGARMMSGDLTTGEMVSFNMFLVFMVMPIMQMANVGSQLTEAFAGLDRVEELLAQDPEGAEPSRTNDLGDLRGDLAFESVSFSYGEGPEVIRDVSFEVKSGTVTALVGSSGSGKSTIAGLAASFLTPDAGVVRIDGLDLKTVRLGTYRKHLGVVLQDDFLFAGSVRENLRFASPEATDAEVEMAVRAAHVDEFTDRFDEKLETIIGERGVRLSGGQRQRVSIARAILADPRVLILDEATSSLDTENEQLIQESLASLMEGRTTLVIAHRLSTIRRADQILVIENGEVVERGTHDALIERGGRYHELYTYQARI